MICASALSSSGQINAQIVSGQDYASILMDAAMHTNIHLAALIWSKKPTVSNACNFLASFARLVPNLWYQREMWHERSFHEHVTPATPMLQRPFFSKSKPLDRHAHAPLDTHGCATMHLCKTDQRKRVRVAKDLKVQAWADWSLSVQAVPSHHPARHMLMQPSFRIISGDTHLSHLKHPQMNYTTLSHPTSRNCRIRACEHQFICAAYKTREVFARSHYNVQSAIIIERVTNSDAVRSVVLVFGHLCCAVSASAFCGCWFRD